MGREVVLEEQQTATQQDEQLAVTSEEQQAATTEKASWRSNEQGRTGRKGKMTNKKRRGDVVEPKSAPKKFLNLLNFLTIY